MCRVVSVPRGDAVLGCLRDLGNESRAGGKPPAASPACAISSATGMPGRPSERWGCSSLWGFPTGVLYFGAVEGFTGLWGPRQVGGAALQPTVSQCCPPEVPVHVMATKLCWAVGDITMGTRPFGGHFPLFKDA